MRRSVKHIGIIFSSWKLDTETETRIQQVAYQITSVCKNQTDIIEHNWKNSTNKSTPLQAYHIKCHGME